VVTDYLDVVCENLKYDISTAGNYQFCSLIFMFNKFYSDEPIVDNIGDASKSDQLTETRQQGRPSDYLRARCPLCFGGQKIYNPQEM
jgi:hypothetical protein